MGCAHSKKKEAAASPAVANVKADPRKSNYSSSEGGDSPATSKSSSAEASSQLATSANGGEEVPLVDEEEEASLPIAQTARFTAPPDVAAATSSPLLEFLQNKNSDEITEALLPFLDKESFQNASSSCVQLQESLWKAFVRTKWPMSPTQIVRGTTTTASSGHDDDDDDQFFASVAALFHD